MKPSQEEERLIEAISAECQGFFRHPDSGADRLRTLCVDLARLGQNIVYTYPRDEVRFWLETRDNGADGWRHYLDERAIPNGAGLDVWFNGQWFEAIYTAIGIGDKDRAPYAFLTLETRPRTVLHTASEEVVVARWPRRR